MSLINDALKRAKESQRKDTPSGLSPLRPVETNLKERDFNLVLPVVIIFLAVTAFILIGLAMTRHAGKGPAEKNGAAPVIAPKPEIAAAVPLVTNPPATAATSPANSPVVSKPVGATASDAYPVGDMTYTFQHVSTLAVTNPIANAPAPVPKPLRLQGIAYDAVHPSAIIGGKAVYVGSFVDGMHVTAIAPNSVTLAGAGGTKTLVVGQP